MKALQKSTKTLIRDTMNNAKFLNNHEEAKQESNETKKTKEEPKK